VDGLWRDAPATRAVDGLWRDAPATRAVDGLWRDAPVIFDDQEGMCVRQVDGSLDHEFHEFSRMKRGLRGRLQDLDGFVPIRVIRGLRSIFLTTNLTNFHE
jgi:hypothetical protein